MQVKLLILSVLIVFTNCTAKKQIKTDLPVNFTKYWYNGKAEINSFNLKQARYGEIRSGEAVLIFVTEDFSNKKLVKLDEPGKSTDETPVLKLNFTKQFTTGIYPYHMMASVFSPLKNAVDNKPIKINCSSQEWCGHTFSQLELKNTNYNWQLHSYFETEGEQDYKIDTCLTEDGLWNSIRINPNTLPQGKKIIIPGLLWQRLSHTIMTKEEAVLQLTTNAEFAGDSLGVNMYAIIYPAAKRSLNIYFKNEFPYKIIGWKESYPDGFGNNKKILTTIATLNKSIMLDYWKHNKNIDSSFRDSLGLH